MNISFGEFVISDDKSLLDLRRVQELLCTTYWARGRSLETVKRSAENSICFGVYHEGALVGFARCVTDYSTMYWLADVIIDPAYRGRGLGNALIDAVTSHEELRLLKGMLVTDDAHELYSRFGFEAENGRYMRRKPTENN